MKCWTFRTGNTVNVQCLPGNIKRLLDISGREQRIRLVDAMCFFSHDGQLHKQSMTEARLGLIKIVILSSEFNQVGYRSQG